MSRTLLETFRKLQTEPLIYRLHPYIYIFQQSRHSFCQSPISLASSSVSALLRYVFLTRSVFPDGSVTPVLGIGGSPSFCCSLSAMTRNARRPIFILWSKHRGIRKAKRIMWWYYIKWYCTLYWSIMRYNGVSGRETPLP